MEKPKKPTQKPAAPLEKIIIGSNALITVESLENIPAKVDTGADSSSIWATDINIGEDGKLNFVLLGPEHPLYTGKKIVVDRFTVRRVRNSTGDVSIRYLVSLGAVIEGRFLFTKFTLSNRSRNNFPVLIGRKTLRNKFLVDVAKTTVPRPRPMDNASLNAKLRKDPHSFHAKYMEKPEAKATDPPASPDSPNEEPSKTE